MPGVLTGLGGIVLIVSPLQSAAALTLVAGLWLAALGVLEIGHGLRLRAHHTGASGPTAE